MTDLRKIRKIAAPYILEVSCFFGLFLLESRRYVIMSMGTKDFIEMRGTVEELLPSASFKIKLENDQIILGHLSGKMRKFRIRLLPGDEVKVEISPYDLTKGRVVYRF